MGAPVEIASASCSLLFSLTTGIINKLLKIVIIAKSKLNSIETLISQLLIDSEIEKEKYKKMKENIRIMKMEKINAKKD